MKIRLKYFAIIISLVVTANLLYGQSFVAITIDDVPNTGKLQKGTGESVLLNKLDSINIPVAVFINEGLIYKGKSVSNNRELLENWIKRNYITIGNHSFSHYRYSGVSPDTFTVDIEKGELISREMACKYNKPLKYFRFPFNDLGQDSIQHANINNYLASKGYYPAPFSIESSDWMYNSIYEYYLNKNDLVKAAEIGREYVAKTIEYFDFFQSVVLKLYGRPINHIYLCHDNSLNAGYLPLLVGQLKEKNYSFIDLDTALYDEAYKQTDNYYKKWGISWIYRWMKSQGDRNFYMNKEPQMEEIEKLYKELVQEQKENKNYTQ